MKNINFDIDLDFADRDLALTLLDHTPAAIVRDGKLIKHPTGVYCTDVPIDPYTDSCSIDHKIAEQLGYFKLDFLNVNWYKNIQSRSQLKELVQSPVDWKLLDDETIFSNLSHIGDHRDLYDRLAEPITNLSHMAMFLAMIRPAKRNLVGKRWYQIEKSIWERPASDAYFFKKSHAFSYAMLVKVQLVLAGMNAANQGNITAFTFVD